MKRGLGRPVFTAGAVLGACVLAPYGLRVYQLSRTPQPDLIIAGHSAGPGESLPSGGQATVRKLPPPPAVKLPAEVTIHVAGAVKKPGVYHLPEGARVDDAVSIAGGARDDAYLDGINLASHVEDGQQLYVPSKQDRSSGGAADPPPSSASAKPPGKPRASASHAVAKLKKPGDGTVNLNTATAAELEKLPGVGASYAQRILEHRKENGGFQQIEQIMDVKGIGEKKFEKMKPFLRVK